MRARLAVFVSILLLAAPAARAEEHLTVGGRERDYSLHRPETAPDGPLPLVIVLHGGLGSGGQAERAYGWNALADAEGFLVAYPDGARRTWNAAGGCCGPAFKNDVDDIGFLDTLIDSLVTDGQADPDRVYIAGISNGGAMAYRYACEGAHAVAAIGSVAGAMTFDCPALRPVSVMEIHGLQDRSVPFAGGPGRRDAIAHVEWRAAEATLAAFRAAASCGAGVTGVRDVVEATRWDCAQGREIQLIAIADAGHQWPGHSNARPLAALILDLDEPSMALDATATLWDFFAPLRAE